jgi:AcrR family transcriptional regulator
MTETAPSSTAARDRAKSSKSARTRVRMDPDNRERMILEGAVRFFAKRGFAAHTRELAEELGVSQSLVFHYFGSKEALIERVYQRNFLLGWRADWVEQLRDRAKPLRQRLKEYYLSYLSVVDYHDWIRVAMFSGLEGNDLTRRYIETQVALIMRTIAEEINFQRFGHEQGNITPVDMERVWHLHSSMIYYLIRKHLFKTAAVQSHQDLVDVVVDTFIDGIPGSHA